MEENAKHIITGTVLSITSDQIRTILKKNFTEVVNEVPAGLVDRFTEQVVKDCEKRSTENCLFWSHVIKKLRDKKVAR